MDHFLWLCWLPRRYIPWISWFVYPQKRPMSVLISPFSGGLIPHFRDGGHTNQDGHFLWVYIYSLYTRLSRLCSFEVLVALSQLKQPNSPTRERDSVSKKTHVGQSLIVPVLVASVDFWWHFFSNLADFVKKIAHVRQQLWAPRCSPWNRSFYSLELDDIMISARAQNCVGWTLIR